MASPSARAKIVGGSVAAAILLAVPAVQGFEGLVLHPHRDMVGTADVCYGDTAAEQRTYTPDECAVMLVARLAKDYAPPVIKCVPALADRPKQLAASLSLSYNIGTAAFCKSTVAKRFNAGDWAGGCDAFLAWRFAGGKPVQGLLNRRKSEQQLCRSDL